MPTSTIQAGRHILTFEDLHSRDAIRWAVGSKDGRRSSTWRLWGDKKGDVYLAMRSLGSILKVSFHRDKRCSVGFTKTYEQTAAQRFGTNSRHWERWTLPEGEVVIPDSELAFFDAEEAQPMR